ncbi:MAG: bifunctional diaminohydroxyphosphoribosylaminopyrimidine deaminase/5-amino-6-(5-phosphoribosylamino)uracil reductase RibD [Deferribacteraceae bacterium]|jgi:diaminohydroxyphosphoribosylaminopyrimidine deaminase/5-amino-6-(5-phosphoribosylamino)uracil reductase|nr:bifunctional diaminohydroxyphosphoribosylaminopyrimidine deaminase/5-amino-6-(5-phosphoribosylamino)uracil reductase RibD [Deferribacteraceae bacterium]
MSADKYMLRAAELALLGKGYTKTNPCVGAVIVQNGEIAGEGWHTAYGAPHAEAEAINCAGYKTEGADLYVTLEPCTTHGKTPPCTDAIIKSGIKRVFAGVPDPNPLHTGVALKTLTERGIEVIYGVEAKLCASLIEDFTKYTLTDLPYVTMKIAQSLDGKITSASGESRWITGQESRNEVHKIRKENDAVLVGIGTVLADNPELTVRNVPSDRQPVRVILDSGCKIPPDSKLVTSTDLAETILFTTNRASDKKVSQLRDYGVNVIVKDKLTVYEVLTELGALNIMNVLAEGGASVFASFLAEKQADMLHLFIAPILIGGKSSKDSIGGSGAAFLKDAPKVTDVKISNAGDDIWLRGKLNDYTGKVLELMAGQN